MLTIITLILIILGIIISTLILLQMPRESNLDVKTTFDATLDYLTPVNNFIEREFYFAVDRRINSLLADTESRVRYFLQSLRENKEISEFISEIMLNVSLRMSKNLKNSFFRVYAKATTVSDKNDPQIDDNLSHYISRYVMTLIREIVVNSAQEINSSNFNETKFADEFLLHIENKLRDKLGFNVKK